MKRLLALFLMCLIAVTAYCQYSAHHRQFQRIVPPPPPPPNWPGTVIFLEDAAIYYTSTADGGTDAWLDPVRNISATQTTHLSKPLLGTTGLKFEQGNSTSAFLGISHISSLIPPFTINFCGGASFTGGVNTNAAYGVEPATWPTTAFPAITYKYIAGMGVRYTDYLQGGGVGPLFGQNAISTPHVFTVRVRAQNDVDIWFNGVELIHGQATDTPGIWGTRFVLGNYPSRSMPWPSVYAFSYNNRALTDEEIGILSTRWRGKYP